MKKRYTFFVMLITATILLSACAQQPQPIQTVIVKEEVVVAGTPEVKEVVKEVVKTVEVLKDVPVIKIGAVLPLTGDAALNGYNQQRGHEMAVEEINNAGGIKCLNGAKLQMVYGDHGGSAEKGNVETERLITKDNVIAIMGPYDSGVALTGTLVAEKYKVPYIVPNALQEEIVTRGLKYTFKTALGVPQMARDDITFIQEHGATSVAILTPSHSFGDEFRKNWKASAEEAGVEVLAEVKYVFGGTDFSDAILSIKAADPDVLLTVGDGGDPVLLLRQMSELGYWPKMGIVTAGGGFSDSSVIQNLAEKGYGIFLTSDWFPNSNMPGSKEVNEKFKNLYGIDMTGNINTTYAATWIVAAALEKACSLDPQVLAETLHTSEFVEGPWNFMYPSVSFDERGMIKDTKNVIAQIIDEVPYAVWPAEYAVRDLVWPVPGWDQR